MKPVLERPDLAAPYPWLVMAQSTRLGGVSSGAYTSLNLGLNTSDESERVTQNRKLLWEALGTSEAGVATGYQVHGDGIKCVTVPGYFEGYDAFITDLSGVFLAVSTADCVPVLICDPVKRVIAAVHAGWKGTVLGITGKTLSVMRSRYGVDPKDCIAAIGAAIGFDSFEVGPEVASKFAADFVKPAGMEEKYLVDLKQANKRQLLEAGLPDKSVEVSDYCTVKDVGRFFSHRKENGVTGRMLAVVGMR